MNYHAHIYWRNELEKQVALDIRSRLVEIGCRVGRVHDTSVGPHPLPMFQAMYDSLGQYMVESLLTSSHGNLSVLLHEDINDDVRDHTEGARWLGEPLQLDLVWLENYTNNRGT